MIKDDWLARTRVFALCSGLKQFRRHTGFARLFDYQRHVLQTFIRTAMSFYDRAQVLNQRHVTKSWKNDEIIDVRTSRNSSAGEEDLDKKWQCHNHKGDVAGTPTAERVSSKMRTVRCVRDFLRHISLGSAALRPVHGSTNVWKASASFWKGI